MPATSEEIVERCQWSYDHMIEEVKRLSLAFMELNNNVAALQIQLNQTMQQLLVMEQRLAEPTDADETGNI